MRLFLAAAICVAGWRGYSQVGRFATLPEGFQRVELEVAGVAREALIYAPANAKAK